MKLNFKRENGWFKLKREQGWAKLMSKVSRRRGKRKYYDYYEGN